MLCISKVSTTFKETCEVGKDARQTCNYLSVSGNNQIPSCNVNVKFRDNLCETFDIVPRMYSVVSK